MVYRERSPLPCVAQPRQSSRPHHTMSPHMAYQCARFTRSLAPPVPSLSRLLSL